MSFNIKRDKTTKKKVDVIRTLDEIHTEKMQEFKESGDQEKENEYLLLVGNTLMEYYSIAYDTITDTNTKINFKDMTNSVETKGEKQKIVERYYELLNIEFPKKLELKSLDCENCLNEMSRSDESFLVCFNCGLIDPEKIIDGLNYEERCEINQVFVFDYKRINYFTEWLNQIQANEITEIPEEIIEDLKLELFKRNIKDTSKLTNLKLKKILKETNYSKYYEHIPLIISKLCKNSKPLIIPENIIVELKNMFLLIQEPFEKFKGDRKNFLSYPYILYKFCEILGLEEYLDNFSLLKSRDKLMKSDIIWRKIVNQIFKKTGDYKWKYIASC